MLEEFQKDSQLHQPSPDHGYRKGCFFRRAIAFLIDHLLLICLTYLALRGSIVVLLLNMFSSALKFGTVITIIILFFEIYFTIFEWIWDGKTPGKWFAGIKVTRSDGGKIDFAGSLTRNFLRCIYFIPPVFILPDIVCIILSPEQKRIGDLIAGTIVTRNKPVSSQSLDSNEPLSSTKDVIY